MTVTPTAPPETPTAARRMQVRKRNGDHEDVDVNKIVRAVERVATDLDEVDPMRVATRTISGLYDGATTAELDRLSIQTAAEMIGEEPQYSRLAARLLAGYIEKEVRNQGVASFSQSVALGHAEGLIGEDTARFVKDNARKLDFAICGDADRRFEYFGLRTVYDRYLLRHPTTRLVIESPQYFLLRVACGLSHTPAEAIEFYRLMASLAYLPSSPTLFNSGTQRSQLSSCYLTTVSDDLDGIYEAIKENALLSKFAGGLGNDWTNVRAMGSHIKGTNGRSQGVVPFLKVVNDTAVAVNQGGKRKGAVCTYLETWHLDIEEFLELRKNTGDDRRRTHDMNTANWIPDLFMKRVVEGGDWTLFSPADVPDLHDKWGRAFEEAYVRYEEKAARGELKLHKRIPAVQLWRKMLSMLFETGHPWITFKDACNVRSPQQHVGTVHSSNLCTEITLNTSATEIAVCNLGSVNLLAHMHEVDGRHELDQAKLARTITTAMRMLDNVIDINYYAVAKARNSNLKHRPVGLGIMGFQDCLHAMRVPYGSAAALQFADTSMEAVCYHAYWASTKLAEERGRYTSYKGSLWDRGILPQDTLRLLRDERGGYVDIDESETLDWPALRARIAEHGMRNSNCIAIAPTATISNIIGVAASIEPEYQNIYVKSNLSGEFTVVNEQLVRDLKALGLWDDVMVADLKYFDGSLAKIDRAPVELRELYATAFEVDASWLVEAGARRQKWIDQAQSLNIYMAGASGKKLDETYKLAWVRGLKTTYYLRTLAATSAEKSTGRGGELNAVPELTAVASIGGAGRAGNVPATGAEPKFCAIDNPECEACQ